MARLHDLRRVVDRRDGVGVGMLELDGADLRLVGDVEKDLVDLLAGLAVAGEAHHVRTRALEGVVGGQEAEVRAVGGFAGRDDGFGGAFGVEVPGLARRVHDLDVEGLGRGLVEDGDVGAGEFVGFDDAMEAPVGPEEAVVVDRDGEGVVEEVEVSHDPLVVLAVVVDCVDLFGLCVEEKNAFFDVVQGDSVGPQSTCRLCFKKMFE